MCGRHYPMLMLSTGFWLNYRDAASAANATPAARIASAWLVSCSKTGGGIVSDWTAQVTRLFCQLFLLAHGLFMASFTTGTTSACSRLMPLTASRAEIYAYDFHLRLPARPTLAVMAGCKELAPGIWGMIGGDANCDGEVSEPDISVTWHPLAGTKGYHLGDLNLDGQVDNKDKDDCWQPN